jgi:hypothetical protein
MYGWQARPCMNLHGMYRCNRREIPAGRQRRVEVYLPRLLIACWELGERLL